MSRAATVILVALLAFAAAWAEEQPAARVRIAVDVSGGSARVVLTHSRPVARAVARAGDRLEIVYSEPVLFEPPSREQGDAVLAGWAQQGDRTLVLRLGKDFDRHETFELKNPSRLVVDLVGRGASPQPAAPASRPSGTIVVIDPGHGGVENGAVGPQGLLEKEVTLDLASRLKAALQRNAGVSVVLTRDDDRLLGLDERTAVANHNRAQLFISIHLNASRRAQARGAETYYLSADATDDEARTLAALENRAHGAGPEAGAATRGSSSGDLDLILWDLAQNQYLAESSRLAEAVQQELNALAGTRDRGVRQAPFRVLMGATMPAILVEVGFISNREEEALLQSSGYRDRAVEAIARAVESFLRGRVVLEDPVRHGAGAARP